MKLIFLGGVGGRGGTGKILFLIATGAGALAPGAVAPGAGAVAPGAGAAATFKEISSA